MNLTRRFRYWNSIKTNDVSYLDSFGLQASISDKVPLFIYWSWSGLLFLLLLFAGFIQSLISLKAKSALCFSFIRQMSPSQAMSNRSAPSVRLHPPGLVCSLLASVSCHCLAPTVCLPSTFFFWAWHSDALSLSGSVSVCVFHFLPWLLLFFCLLFLYPSLFLFSLLTQTPQSKQLADYVREKVKRSSATWGIKKEVFYLCLFWHHN